MSITVSEFIEDFARKLSADQVSLFIGAGVSTEIGLPDWKMLFSDVAKALSLNIELIDDYYQLSQYYCNKYSILHLILARSCTVYGRLRGFAQPDVPYDRLPISQYIDNQGTLALSQLQSLCTR